MMEENSYYHILDIKPDATQNEIRQAYFRIKTAYSKDSAALYTLFDHQESRAILNRIEEAYLVLSNQEKRKEYDKIHGFFGKTPNNNDLIPESSKKPLNSSYTGSGQKKKSEPNMADEAAEAMFGSEVLDHQDSSYKESTIENENFLKSDDSIESDIQNEKSSNNSEENNKDNHYENRLGIIRRRDLSKSHEKNSAIEEEIANETEFRGSTLKKIREYRNISIEELSEFTKISKTYLNCIELEEFEALPAPVYLRGFIVQVAKALKLPHEKVAKAYMSYYKNNK